MFPEFFSSSVNFQICVSRTPHFPSRAPTFFPFESHDWFNFRPSSQPLAAARHPAPRLDMETLIAGKWLNRLGILALLFAVSFFIKYAFDNNWVGPRGRVAIGLLLGSALLPWSGWLLRRGYPYFSEGIAGLGAAGLYLSLWAGWHYYRL